MATQIKKDAMRLFEAGLECLALAISSLGTPKRLDYHVLSSSRSPEAGLLGAAIEMAMSACLIQCYGDQKITTGKRFKTFAEINSDFRKMMELDPPPIFLVKGVSSQEKHIDLLKSYSTSFNIFGQIRAGALHAGRGPLREAIAIEATRVSDFYETIASASYLGPYLSNIPRALMTPNQELLIVEDLARRFNQADPEEKRELIPSLFLVLPDIPEDQPAWLDAFERFTVCPEETDTVYLLSVLERAIPATLQKASSGSKGLSVRVEPENPNALPIAPHDLRTTFRSAKDRWNSSSAVANGRLDEGYLELPSSDSVREAFCLGQLNGEIADPESTFSAHKTWPFVAASMDIQAMTGPFWFVIQRCEDHGQLRSLLDRVASIGNRRLARRINECKLGMALLGEHDVEEESIRTAFDWIPKWRETQTEERSKLLDRIKRHFGASEALPANLLEIAGDIIHGNAGIKSFLDVVLKKADAKDRSYWLRVTTPLAKAPEDLPTLHEVMREKANSAAFTNIRKSIAYHDLMMHGPGERVLKAFGL